MPMASRTLLQQAEAFRQSNIDAARRILADVAKYGGETALVVEWARTILQLEKKR